MIPLFTNIAITSRLIAETFYISPFLNSTDFLQKTFIFLLFVDNGWRNRKRGKSEGKTFEFLSHKIIPNLHVTAFDLDYIRLVLE